MTSQVVLLVSRHGGSPAEIVPVLNEVPLLELVTRYEESRGYDPSGGYAGLIPEHFSVGDLTQYYLGREQQRQWPRPGVLWLLGCDCGEVGCWPLEAQITLAGSTVTWSDFRQPHRSEWDYSGFGPFVFLREDYEAAVASAVEQLDPR